MTVSVLRALIVAALVAAIPARAGLLTETPQAPEEADVRLPAFPGADAPLERFTAGGNTRNAFYLDPASISVEPSGVIRYTVIIESPRGVRNVLFEGVMCARGEARSYAIGSKAGEWVLSRHAAWQPVEAGYNSYRFALTRYVFCDGVVPVRSVDEAMRRLHDKSIDPEPVFLQ